MLRRSSLRFVLLAPLALLCACGPSSTGDNDGGLMKPDFKMPVDTLDQDHDGYTVAEGDCDDHDPTVYPRPIEDELKYCGDYKDHTCHQIANWGCDNDGDGYVWKGNFQGPVAADEDCNDSDPLINPGAYERTDNSVDDNCNGQTDEATPSCDVSVPLTGDTGLDYAHSMELCSPWLQSAVFNSRSPVSGRAVTKKLGVNFSPQAGQTMVHFSTGLATDGIRTRTFAPQPGTEFKLKDTNPLPIRSYDVCDGQKYLAASQINDPTIFTLTIKAPTNAKGFAFRFNFFTAEYPEFVGSPFNDMFMAVLDSQSYQGNVCFDNDGNPVTVNSSFLNICTNENICSGINNALLNYHSCGLGGKNTLNGTGYDLTPVGHDSKNYGDAMGGATGWLRTTAPVTPGETFTLKFVIFDGGTNDFQYDSAVLLDDFEWLFDDTGTETQVQ